MYLAIDVGGTKTLLATFSARGRLQNSVRFPTDPDQHRWLITVLEHLKTEFDLSHTQAAAIALPGPVQNNKPVFYGNLPWGSYDIGEEVSRILKIPVTVANDARTSALAEGRRFRTGRSLFITLSTGIGVGVVNRGKLDPEFTTYEPGHAKFNWQGKTLEWEDIASAKAVSTLYKRPVDTITNADHWDDIADRIAIGLAPVVSATRPTRIIFGGPLGEMLPRYRERLREAIKLNHAPPVRVPRMINTKHGADSVLYGCYILASSLKK